MGGAGWFKNAVIYHILIDRFAGFKSTDNWDKPVFIGGNINGIIEKLPYLQDLGVNTLWISPFFKTSEYHGYHITDFYQVDPHFGTTNDIEKLIQSVHKNDMKIITDFVPNHCSNEHPFFKDAQQNINSEYRNWFYFTKWPNNYLCFLSINQLPKINLDHPPARDHILNAAKYWLNLGFDGYRLDHVVGPSHRFWKQFKNVIKKENPNAVLIGEAWMRGVKLGELKTIKTNHKFIKWLFGASSDNLLKEYIELLDGVLDFRIQELLREVIARENIQYIKKPLSKEIKKHYEQYPTHHYLPTFLDNHDMDRFLYESKNDKEKLKKAAEIQFSLDQPPIIYYGTETGLTQEKSIWNFESHGDIQARKPMNWKKPDSELLSFYKKLIKQKKSN